MNADDFVYTEMQHKLIKEQKMVCYACGYKYDYELGRTEEHDTINKCPKCGAENYVGF